MSTPDQGGAFLTWVDEAAPSGEDGKATETAGLGRVLYPTWEELPRLSLDGTEAQLALGKTIGVGGMAEVRVAEQRALRRMVAVKRLRPERDDPASRGGLLREALVQAQLDHPNVVPVHLVAADADGRPFLVMKRVEGAPWSHLIAEPDRIAAVTGEPAHDVLDFHVQVLIGVCRAVEVAHSHGVLHRDLKPDNVMIGRFGQVWLMDWGLAVAFTDDARSWLPPVEQVQRVAGTPGYMAPEMARAQGAAMTPATDVYLLGATLHHVLTGAPRHADPDVLARLAHAYASPPAEYDVSVPEELAELCNASCHVTASARPRSVAVFRRALEGFLRHRASRELTADAAATAHALQAGTVGLADGERARFGFDQALKLWPHNARAREGKAALVRYLLGRAADDDRLHDARRLLAELTDPTDADRAVVAAMEARRDARDAELARLRDRDDVGARGAQRAWIWFVIGLAGMLLFIALDRARGGGAEDFAVWLGGLVALTGAALGAHEAVLPRGQVSEGAERVRRTTWIRGASGPIFVVVAWWLDVPLDGALALHLLALGLHQLAVRAALGLQQNAAYSGYAQIVGGLALLLHPPWPLATYGCALAAGHMLLGLWSAGAERAAR